MKERERFWVLGFWWNNLKKGLERLKAAIEARDGNKSSFKTTQIIDEFFIRVVKNDIVEIKGNKLINFNTLINVRPFYVFQGVKRKIPPTHRKM